MGERFRHINEQAGWFMLEKTAARQLSYVNNVIMLTYVTDYQLTNTHNKPLTNHQKHSYHIREYDEYLTQYEYKLTLYDVYENFYPQYLNPDNQNLPHEWVWSLYYE